MEGQGEKYIPPGKRQRHEDQSHQTVETKDGHPEEIRHKVPHSGHPQTKSLRTFPIKPISRFKRQFPFFRQPAEVGHFSLDAQRNVHCDDRHLKAYWPPTDPQRCGFDLRAGYRDFIKRDDDVKERLNNLTRWVLGNKRVIGVPVPSSDKDSPVEEDRMDEKIDRLNADFVMWRGHATKFLCTPYESRDGWAMAVTLYRGTYYISEVETAENRARRKGMSQKELEMTFWGYKFEQYLTSDDGKKPPDTSVPVNNHEAYCSVIRTRLESHTLLYSGEVDCRCPATGGNRSKAPPGNYVELKTSRMWYNQNNERNFYRFKLLKMWAQSFLVGIPEVICGFRDDDGIVSYLKSFQTLDMPNSSNGAWDGAVCFNFLNQLLTYIKEVVTIDDPRVAYMLERRPGASELTCTLHTDRSEQFLSEEYIASFK